MMKSLVSKAELEKYTADSDAAQRMVDEKNRELAEAQEQLEQKMAEVEKATATAGDVMAAKNNEISDLREKLQN